MSILHILLIIITVVVAIVAIIVYRRVFNGDRADPGLLGCRVKYFDSGGTSFGYVSREEPGKMLILQNPWKEKETVPIAKESVQFIDKQYWNDVVDTKTGSSIWDIEKSASTRELFDFYGISPRTCLQ